MSRSNELDVRGLSCPQPVMMVLQRLKELGSGTLTVLVDSDTSRENISRTAASAGWQVEVETAVGKLVSRVVLTKS